MNRNATNPFTFGDLALDDAFTDREAEVRELTSDMRNGQNVLVYAPRRYGKSSLVLRAAQEAMRQKVLVAYCDLMKTPTKERFAAALARTIHTDIASPIEQAFIQRSLATANGLYETVKILSRLAECLQQQLAEGEARPTVLARLEQQESRQVEPPP